MLQKGYENVTLSTRVVCRDLDFSVLLVEHKVHQVISLSSQSLDPIIYGTKLRPEMIVKTTKYPHFWPLFAGK
jgi:hypothetical protein